MFLDPDFLYDGGVLAIHGHSRQKLAYSCLHGFSGTFDPKWQFWGQNRRRGGAVLTPTNVFLLRSPYVIGQTIIFLPCDFYCSFFFFSFLA